MSNSVKIYLDTYGCQMNQYDGELVISLLESRGFSFTGIEQNADVILINTCSVREHAEQRALGRLHSLGSLKKHRPGLVIGVLGCMAERLRDNLREIAPEVDLAVGPDAYRKLPDLLRKHLNGHQGNFSYLPGCSGELYGDIQPTRRQGISAFATIMRGCDNFCSYCIVPHVRGRERSRSADEVISEVQRAVDNGCVEVTLLGQNVNSYHWNQLDFPDLLSQVAKVPGLRRLRFLTSHPRDLSDKLIELLAASGVLCPSLHLPAQAGSDRILAKMNRGYTKEEYLTKVQKLRRQIPDLMLTTDLLCGFPSEEESDFQQTLDLVEQAQFDDAFTFRYSPRPGTTAYQFEDDVPEDVKIERLQRMIALCRRIADRSREKMIHKEVTILLENPSPKNPLEWMGRTESGCVALVPGEYSPGEEVRVKVQDVRGFSLWGKPISITQNALNI